jgi:hypothetical protein
MQTAKHPFIQPNPPLAVSQMPSSQAEVDLSPMPLPQSLTHPSMPQFKDTIGQPTQKSPGTIRYQPAAHPTDPHAVTMGALTILVPLGFVISILVHRRLKTTALRRQIAALERLWRLNCHEEIQ